MTIETKKARFTKEELATEFEIGNLEERFNAAKEIVRYRVNSKGTKCWSLYGVYDDKQIKVNGIIKSTAKTGWHNAAAKVADDMLVQKVGITLVDFLNIEEFMNNRKENQVNVEDYAVSTDAQDIAIDAEIELANAEDTTEIKAADNEPALWANVEIETAKPHQLKKLATKIISVDQFNTLMTWAEKISNGQHDAVTQIETHLDKWLGYRMPITGTEEIISYIEEDDLNGFRRFLSQFPFLIKSDAGYLYALYSSITGDNNYIKVVVSELPTSEQQAINAVITPAIEDDDPKFEVGKTYYIMDGGKPFTLKVEARTDKMLTATTINGTRKYHIHDTIRGEYVDTDLRDEFGNAEMIWAANEYKPVEVTAETKDDNGDDNDYDETDEPEILNADLFVNLYNSPHAEKYSSTTRTINGEVLHFHRHKLTHISAPALNLKVFFNNGRVNFWHGYKRIARDKVWQVPIIKETAKAQEESFRKFFAGSVHNNGFFRVTVNPTFADGKEHNYVNYFEYFNQAQAFVGKVKKIIGDVPTFIFITYRLVSFYLRLPNGSENYNLPNVDATEAQSRIDELNKAIADNESFADTADEETASLLRVANYNINQSIIFYEAALRMTEPMTKEEIERRMSEIVDERNEIFDELKQIEAETGDEDELTPQSHIDYLNEYADALLDEYNELWRQLERLKAKDIPTNAPDNSTPDKIRDSLARGMEQCLLKMQEHFAEHNLTAAHKEWKLYLICSQALHDVKEVMTA